jgi:hypothetical protein
VRIIRPQLGHLGKRLEEAEGAVEDAGLLLPGQAHEPQTVGQGALLRALAGPGLRHDNGGYRRGRCDKRNDQ